MARRTKQSNKALPYFLITLLIVFLAGGCAKKLTTPEVEADNAPVEEQAPVPEEEIAESVFEDKGFDIQEGDTQASGEFITEGPNGEAGMADSGDNGEGSAPDFDAGGSNNDFSSNEDFGMSTQNDAFEAQPFEDAGDTADTSTSDSAGSFDAFANDGTSAPESDPVADEARLLSFKSETKLQDIHFEFDRYDLDDRTKQVLQQNATWLRDNPNARVEIQGHCDERGTNNYNLGLGERRAIATKKYLVALGVDASRLYTISYGEEKPFCLESNEMCWHDNRRAHFMVAD